MAVRPSVASISAARSAAGREASRALRNRISVPGPRPGVRTNTVIGSLDRLDRHAARKLRRRVEVGADVALAGVGVGVLGRPAAALALALGGELVVGPVGCAELVEVVVVESVVSHARSSCLAARARA